MDIIKLEILLKYLTSHLYLKYDAKTNVWNIELSDKLLKPISSNWYNQNRDFLNLDLKIETFVSLNDGVQERFSLNFIPKNNNSSHNYYSEFSFYNIFRDNLFYIQNKEECKTLEYYGIENSGDRVRLTVGKCSESSSNYYSKAKLLKLFKARHIKLLKLKNILEASKIKNPKAGKVSYYYNEFSKSLKELVFSESDVLYFKSLVNIKASNYIYPVHEFINNVAKVLGVNVKDSSKWTIDNGWGSYTYTFIRNVIDLDQLSDEEYLVLQFAWAYYKKNNKLSSREADRFLEMTRHTLGMVQSSGGYTHVSG